MLFHDKVSITRKQKLADGRVVVDSRFARAGIYHYAGTEVGRPDMQTVRVYRPPAEVFSEDSMRSFAHKAVTDNHPPEHVTAANWNDYSNGYTDGTIKRDGEYVSVPMMLCDAGLIAKVDAGKSELSAGYDAEINFEVGRTPDGEHYDAVMRNIRGNHIAVVDKGRAGAECRIADSSNEGANSMPDPISNAAVSTYVFDGIPIDVTATARAALEKQGGLLRDAAGAMERATSEHKVAIEAKDSIIATKDAEIAALKAAALTDEQLDARIVERATLLAGVAKVADGVETKGKTPDELKKAACAKAMGDTAVEGRDAAYIAVLFDALVARADAKAKEGGNGDGAAQPKRDALAEALGGTLPGGDGARADAAPTDGGAAYKKMKDRMSSAWETPALEAAA